MAYNGGGHFPLVPRFSQLDALAGQIRNPKLDIPNKSKIQKSKCTIAGVGAFGLWFLNFEFVWDFGFRASDFVSTAFVPTELPRARARAAGVLAMGAHRIGLRHGRASFERPVRQTTCRRRNIRLSESTERESPEKGKHEDMQETAWLHYVFI
jgi:hypothetical protein